MHIIYTQGICFVLNCYEFTFKTCQNNFSTSFWISLLLHDNFTFYNEKSGFRVLFTFCDQHPILKVKIQLNFRCKFGGKSFVLCTFFEHALLMLTSNVESNGRPSFIKDTYWSGGTSPVHNVHFWDQHLMLKVRIDPALFRKQVHCMICAF